MKTVSRRLRSVLICTPILAAGLGLGACGSTKVVDSGKAEKYVRDFISQNGGTPKSVKCPQVDWKQGGTFDCNVTVAGSSGATRSGKITLHMDAYPNVATPTAADVHVQ